jgi:nicotinate-nucleotide adenylyltransferase
MANAFLEKGKHKQKIGFLMGSFDPIHIGHINMVRVALNSGLLDKVILVPSGHNPWKKEDPAPFDLRVQMIEASIKEFGDKCEVSPIEGTFEPPFYSNKPLNHFKEKYSGNELFILCGTDTVNRIPRWRNAATDILPFYGIIEIYRGIEDPMDEGSERYVEDKNGNKYPYQRIIQGSYMTASSTEVRNSIKNGLITYPLINGEVERIIKENKLYSS